MGWVQKYNPTKQLYRWDRTLEQLSVIYIPETESQFLHFIHVKPCKESCDNFYFIDEKTPRLREPKKCALNYKFSRLLGSAAQPGHTISVFTKIKWCPFAYTFSFKPYKNCVEVGRVIIIFPKLKEKGIKLSYSSLLPLKEGHFLWKPISCPPWFRVPIQGSDSGEDHTQEKKRL